MSSEKPSRRFGERADLFAFTPVPTGDVLSTSRSRCGTLIFFVIYMLYIILVLYNFIASNIPKVNQFETGLDDNVIYNAPEMAFAFVTGDNLNQSFYNASYWTFSFQEVTVFQDPNKARIYNRVNLTKCRPTWLNPKFDVLCPDNPGRLQGLLYGSPVNIYPRLKVSLCVQNSSVPCASDQEIQDQLMTGRFFVFLKQQPTENLITGKLIEDDTPYASYFYFMTYDQYNRVELKIKAENMTVKPDLFTSFKDEVKTNLEFGNVNFYVSKVPTNVTHDVFLWWASMSDKTVLTLVAYDTSLDVISKIGAMFSVLFGFFALYFLRYNRSSYYKANTHMSNFDDKISPLVSSVQALRSEGTGDPEGLNSTGRSEKPAASWLHKVVTHPNFELQRMKKNSVTEKLDPKPE